MQDIEDIIPNDKIKADAALARLQKALVNGGCDMNAPLFDMGVFEIHPLRRALQLPGNTVPLVKCMLQVSPRWTCCHVAIIASSGCQMQAKADPNGRIQRTYPKHPLYKRVYRTPLLEAMRRQNRQAIELLLDAKADPFRPGELRVVGLIGASLFACALLPSFPFHSR